MEDLQKEDLLAAPAPKNTKIKNSKHHLEPTATALELEIPGYAFDRAGDDTLDIMLVQIGNFELELAPETAGSRSEWPSKRVVKVDRAELGNTAQVKVAYGYAQSDGEKVIMSEAVTIIL